MTRQPGFSSFAENLRHRSRSTCRARGTSAAARPGSIPTSNKDRNPMIRNRKGIYTSVSSTEALTLQGEAGVEVHDKPLPPTRIFSPLRIRGQAAGRTVTIRGNTVSPTLGVCTVDQVRGTVILDNVTMDFPGRSAAFPIDRSSHVAFRDCRVVGVPRPVDRNIFVEGGDVSNHHVGSPPLVFPTIDVTALESNGFPSGNAGVVKRARVMAHGRGSVLVAGSGHR